MRRAGWPGRTSFQLPEAARRLAQQREAGRAGSQAGRRLKGARSDAPAGAAQPRDRVRPTAQGRKRAANNDQGQVRLRLSEGLSHSLKSTVRNRVTTTLVHNRGPIAESLPQSIRHQPTNSGKDCAAHKKSARRRARLIESFSDVIMPAR